MKLFFQALAVGLCAAMLPLFSDAANPADFYTAVVPVVNQSAPERERALMQGLADIMVKISGTRTVLAEPVVKAALATPDVYALEVGFTHLVAIDPTQPPPLVLTASYAGPAVEKLLRQAQLPVWPVNRPEWLVVLVEDTPAGRSLVSRDDNTQAWQAVDVAMTRRGISVQMPLQDLEDQLALSADDASAANAEKLDALARRYGAAHWFVLGYRVGATGRWQADWTVGGQTDAQHGGPLRGDMVGNDVVAVVTGAIDVAIDRFSPRMASRAAPVAGSVILVVENIRSYQAFSQVSDVLIHLASVTGAAVEGIEGDRVEFSLAVDGDIESVMAAIARDRHFAPVNSSAGPQGPVAQGQGAGATGTAPLRYRWLTP